MRFIDPQIYYSSTKAEMKSWKWPDTFQWNKKKKMPEELAGSRWNCCQSSCLSGILVCVCMCVCLCASVCVCRGKWLPFCYAHFSFALLHFGAFDISVRFVCLLCTWHRQSSTAQAAWLSVYLSLRLSVCLPICLSDSLFDCLSVPLSLSLSATVTAHVVPAKLYFISFRFNLLAFP